MLFIRRGYKSHAGWDGFMPLRFRILDVKEGGVFFSRKLKAAHSRSVSICQTSITIHIPWLPADE